MQGEHETVPVPLCSFHWRREASSAVLLSPVLWPADLLNFVAFVCPRFRPLARGQYISDRVPSHAVSGQISDLVAL